jgi:glycosyltransferase involved in cell wall biosynthesis
VGQAIKSVLHQTYQDFEIIVVDDASTDNTEEVVEGFGDSRIRYLCHQQNLGAPCARNSGANAALGEYLAFLDSDDIWFPKMLERQFNTLSGLPSNVGMICCGLIRKTAESSRVVRFSNRCLTFDENLIHGAGICTSSFLVRKSAFQSIGGFDLNFNSFQDFDFLLRMTIDYRIVTIDDILLEYRLGKDSISINMALKVNGFKRIIDTYRHDIIRLGLMRRYFFRLGQYQILAGCLFEGWKNWLKALNNNTFDTKIWKHFLLSLGGSELYRRVLDFYNRIVDRKNANV